MPYRRTSPPPHAGDWSSDKTRAALKTQLAALDGFRGRGHMEVESDERGWTNLTLNILVHGFGADSNNVRQFKQANVVGRVSGPSMTELQYQHNFVRRMDALAATIKATLAELEWMIPEAEIAGAYESGDDYRFYKDLKTVVGFASKELFIIDNYLDTQLFDVYMENVDPVVTIRVLTDQVGNPLQAVAQKFGKRGNFEMRSSKDVHDRVVFGDDRCWVIGQSIKDAAKKKPTYIVEHGGAATMKGIYEALWTGGRPVVKD